MGDPSEKFIFPGGETFELPVTKEKFVEHLKEKFPEDGAKIDKYVEYVSRSNKEGRLMFVFKSIPNWIARPARWLYHLFKRNWWAVTTSDIMDELGVTD